MEVGCDISYYFTLSREGQSLDRQRLKLESKNQLPLYGLGHVVDNYLGPSNSGRMVGLPASKSQERYYWLCYSLTARYNQPICVDEATVYKKKDAKTDVWMDPGSGAIVYSTKNAVTVNFFD